MVLILGLNAYHADASAALLADGEVIAAVEEAERIIEEVEEARKTEETAAPAIVSRGAGNDGISVWEIDRETIAAVPSAIRTGRATGSMPAVGDEISSTGNESESHPDQRRRGVPASRCL